MKCNALPIRRSTSKIAECLRGFEVEHQPMGYQECGLALDYLSKMKIAVMVRQLDLGHILWCGRVVRVERAHRVRVVRGVQKMLDVGRHGMIDFGHIGIVVRDGVVTYVWREDEFVGCCV